MNLRFLSTDWILSQSTLDGSVPTTESSNEIKRDCFLLCFLFFLYFSFLFICLFVWGQLKYFQWKICVPSLTSTLGHLIKLFLAKQGNLSIAYMTPSIARVFWGDFLLSAFFPFQFIIFLVDSHIRYNDVRGMVRLSCSHICKASNKPLLPSPSLSLQLEQCIATSIFVVCKFMDIIFWDENATALTHPKCLGYISPSCISVFMATKCTWTPLPAW